MIEYRYPLIRRATTEEIQDAMLWRQKQESQRKDQENVILRNKIRITQEEMLVAKVRDEAAKQKQSGKTADREYAARFADFLLSHGSEHEISLFHFGRCELRELLDFIYGRTPASDKERLNNE